MKELTLSVSQLNEYVRRSLASDPMLRNVCITGEISNLKRHSSGHWYFTLKDEEAAINCAMFRQNAFTLRFRPENGQQVRVFGSVGLYAKTGSYQFYVDLMEQEGIGDLYRRFEQLKRRLADEGLFDPSLKKQLPLLPCGIGVVTSKTGAVIHDIARVAWRRFPSMPIYLYPVKVQGDGAAAEIAAGVRLLDRLEAVDVIIVGRGGGSMEDLWAFNEEAVARAIADCRKPVISAVGHETDFSIADFAADVRAATPSAAAELAAPDAKDLNMQVIGLQNVVSREMHRQIERLELRLRTLRTRLEAASPAQRQTQLTARLTAAHSHLQHAFKQALANKQHALQQAALRLRTTGPIETMRRGYAVLLRDGSVIRGADALYPGDELCMKLADGEAYSRVTAVKAATPQGKD